MKTRHRLSVLALGALSIMATACGATTSDTVSTDIDSSYAEQLDARADVALEPTVTLEPTEAPAAPSATVVEVADAPAPEPTAAPEPTVAPVAAATASPAAATNESAEPEPTVSAATAVPAATMTPVAQAPATTSGFFPAWYAPPSELAYVSHRDSANGERRLQTDLTGIDYVTVCNDFRAQAAAVGLMPTTTKQCDDPIISWTEFESPTGADAEIQRLEGLSYDVLFVFDAAAMALAGTGSSSITPSPSADEQAPAAPTPEPASEETTAGLLPPWFNPAVYGSELAHAIDDGTYTIAAIGRIDAPATFTSLCNEFDRQAGAGGWNRQSGDECGEGTFDGVTYVDPVTGFEAKVRNYRGNEISYAFEVAANLTPAEITAIAFDPELAILPTGFTLVPGEQVVALAESIDDTNAYNSAIQVSGPADFEARCERFLQEAGAVQIVLGGCSSADEIVTITYRDTTVILESDIYTFVTRR